jgi:hypothetical protein
LTGIRALYNDGMDINQIKTQIKYDPETGHFNWLKSCRGVRSGAIAGHLHAAYGYRTIYICGKSWRANRLAFFYMTGNMPKGVVDHINMDKDDNRWLNLRDCSQSQNMMNIKKKASNKSSLTGVSWDAGRGKWLAQARINKKKKNLGRYNTKTEAHEAWMKAVYDSGDMEYRRLDAIS